MDITVGKKHSLSHLIDKKTLTTLDDATEYIVHVHRGGTHIDLFERKVEGTPLRYIKSLEVIDPDSYVLPALYGVDKKGKERIWKTWVIGSMVYKTYGEAGGNLIPSIREYQGTNEDKKNSTTPEEQAKREAERDWVKQLDKDYHAKSPEGKLLEKKIRALKKQQGGVNVNIDAAIRDRVIDTPVAKKKSTKKATETVDIRPMLCSEWSMEPKCLKYFDFDSGVYIQPKLDGVRCIAQIKNGEVLLGTRTGKNMMWLEHIRKDILLFLKGNESVILDGEIYAHAIKGKAEYKKNKIVYSPSEEELDADQRFDIISGAARPKRNEPHPLEEQLSYHVFDIVDPTGKLDQDSRFGKLKTLFSRKEKLGVKYVHLVPTRVIYYPEEIEDYHDEMFQLDYEGVVLRSRDLVYEPRRRSLSLRKYKHFVTEEFPIVDISMDEGVERDQFSWVCEKIIEDEEGNKTLSTFKAKPKGTREQRLYWYDNQDEFLGKLLTVKYQNLTPEGMPRFPSGLTIRDYE